jgi:hypothetical protein
MRLILLKNKKIKRAFYVRGAYQDGIGGSGPAGGAPAPAGGGLFRRLVSRGFDDVFHIIAGRAVHLII